MVDWKTYLRTDEVLRWEGRQAPRCYTFRYWRFSLAGVFMLMLLGGWQGGAVPMGAPPLPGVVVLFLAVLALLFLLGLPLRQRLAWERVFYAIGDRQLLLAEGGRIVAIPLEAITAVRLDGQGAELGTLHIERADGTPVILSCLEYPRVPAALLRPDRAPM
jgi:hypothetical protein